METESPQEIFVDVLSASRFSLICFMLRAMTSSNKASNVSAYGAMLLRLSVFWLQAVMWRDKASAVSSCEAVLFGLGLL